MIVVQAEERNMYDQHFLSAVLRDKYPYLYSYKLTIVILLHVIKKKMYVYFSPSDLCYQM